MNFLFQDQPFFTTKFFLSTTKHFIFPLSSVIFGNLQKSVNEFGCVRKADTTKSVYGADAPKTFIHFINCKTMLNKIIAFSIKNKLVIGLFILTLIGYGSYQLTQLPIDAVPDITDNQVQVITLAPSLGAPDIERLITFPIEQANSNIPGLKKIRSFSRFGLSLITIVFDDDVDIYWARQQVTERLKIAEGQIPKGIGNSELAPVTTGLGEIYQYVLKPKKGYETKYDATSLRTIQDWIVKRQLKSVKGIADVSSFGGRVKQYEIAINPSTLKANNITINDVFEALEKNNENTGGAYIEKGSTVLYIRAEVLIGNIEDIKNILVLSRNGINSTPSGKVF